MLHPEGPGNLDSAVVTFPPEIEDLLRGSFYDRAGLPISFETFTELKFSAETRHDIVAITEHGKLTVSTVWLGWVNGHDEHGRPLIFETAIFDADEWMVCGRYTTETTAALHHQLIVGLLRATEPLPALLPGTC